MFFLFRFAFLLFSDEEVFHYRGWACLREDLCSLLDGAEVRVAVIDAWSLLMNAKDIEMGQDSPCRFFYTVTATVSISTPCSFWSVGLLGLTHMFL